jgi:DNA-binding NtrC family response regulator
MNLPLEQHPVVLLVDTRSTNLRRLSDTLQRAGPIVIEATGFDEAKHALIIRRPDALISPLRLGAFNGLHLVHLGRIENPQLQAIILSSDRDFPLHDEIHATGATLLSEPVHLPTLLSLLSDGLEGPRVNGREQLPDRLADGPTQDGPETRFRSTRHD